MLPIIAIVGRPNTGKSTLFNRIIGKKHAITASEAGTTRDRVYMHAEINNRASVIIDTGGLSFDQHQTFDSQIAEQTKLAIAEADIILFVADASLAPTSADYEIAKLLRKTNKPVLLVANKADCSSAREYQHDFYKLGFDKPHEISAIHNMGIGELEDQIAKILPAQSAEPEVTDRIRLGFVGKPNVGKSSLINNLLGKEQLIVSDISGTTRDSTELDFHYQDQNYTLVDTAGIRRRGKQTGIEKFGVLRSLRTIEAVDIALLVIDGEEGLTKQDMHVSEYIIEASKGLVIVINKADLIKPEEKNRLLAYIQAKMQYAYWAPAVFTSAKTGTNTKQILEVAQQVQKQREKRIPTTKLNFFIKKITLKQQPISHSARKPKIGYVNQVDTKPPTFVFFCKNAQNMHFSYKRYIENQLRSEYGFEGTAIKMKFKNDKELG